MKYLEISTSQYDTLSTVLLTLLLGKWKIPEIGNIMEWKIPEEFENMIFEPEENIFSRPALDIRCCSLPPKIWCGTEHWIRPCMSEGGWRGNQVPPGMSLDLRRWRGGIEMFTPSDRGKYSLLPSKNVVSHRCQKNFPRSAPYPLRKCRQRR